MDSIINQSLSSLNLHEASKQDLVRHLRAIVNYCTYYDTKKMIDDAIIQVKDTLTPANVQIMAKTLNPDYPSSVVIVICVCYYVLCAGHTVNVLHDDTEATHAYSTLFMLINIAVKNNHPHVVRGLVRDGLVKYPGDMLELSAKLGHVEVLQELLKDQTIIPTDWTFNHAARLGHVEVVRELLNDKRIVPTDWGFQRAAGLGHIEVVKELLKDKRVDPASNGNHALDQATIFGHIDVVRELLKDERIDPTYSGSHCLCIAIREGHTEIVKIMLEDRRLYPTLSNYICSGMVGNYVVHHNYTKIVQLLMSSDQIDLSACNCSLLQLSAEYGNDEIAAIMLTNPRVKSSSCTWALTIAAASGRVNVVKLLLKDGRANPDCRSNCAMLHAANNHHDNIVMILVSDERVGLVAIDRVLLYAEKNNFPRAVATLERVKSSICDEIHQYAM